MAIDQSDIQRIRAAADIAAVIGDHTTLKRVGRSLVGLCPFHSESTPSFTVNPELGVYHCFGCQASGDVINFICEIEGVNFSEAIQRLAARVGITLAADDYQSNRERSKWRDLSSVMSTTVDFYHEQLRNSESARKARSYLRQRGYTPEIVSKFKLGYAPSDSHKLASLLSGKTDLAIEAGLLSKSSYTNSPVDIFRDRVIFPIFDTGGNPIAIGGRVLPEEFRTITGRAEPKYRNTKESPIYSKKRTLYGLNFSKREISHQDRVVVCEGYTDVIAFHQIATGISVATCGTALTEYHIKTLSNFTKKIILSFDADNAGQEAMARLYGWEEKHGISLLVVKLPEGSDPASLALADPDRLKKALDEAQPYLGFMVARAIDKVGDLDPEYRVQAAERALVAVGAHPNHLIRDEYLAKIADATRLPIDSLRSRLQHLIADTDGKENQSSSNHRLQLTAQQHAPSESLWQTGRSSENARIYTRDKRQQNNGPDMYKNDSRVNNRDISVVSKKDEHPGTAPPKTRVGKRPVSGEIALLLAIHHPELMAGKLTSVLFTDDLQNELFITLTSFESLADAIEHSRQEIQDYLYQLSVLEIPEGTDIDDTLSSLCILATETEIEKILARTRLSPDKKTFEESSHEIEFAKHELEIIKAARADGVYGSQAVLARNELISWLELRKSGGND